MNRILIILLALLPLTVSAAKKKVVKPDVSVVNLRVENLEKPLGIDTAEPRFSWQITSDKQNVRQTAYQIIVSDNKGEVWNTGKVESDQQLWIQYAGKQLQSNTACTWRVKVWTTVGESEWSSDECFSVGLLHEGKWSGYWIGLERLLPGEERGMHTRMAARYLRKEFSLKDKAIKRATAYVAGIGLHEFYVNGQRMGDRVLTPVPSDYRQRRPASALRWAMVAISPCSNTKPTKFIHLATLSVALMSLWNMPTERRSVCRLMTRDGR